MTTHSSMPNSSGFFENVFRPVRVTVPLCPQSEFFEAFHEMALELVFIDLLQVIQAGGDRSLLQQMACPINTIGTFSDSGRNGLFGSRVAVA
jgi:hypothetical protein